MCPFCKLNEQSLSQQVDTAELCQMLLDCLFLFPWENLTEEKIQQYGNYSIQFVTSQFLAVQHIDCPFDISIFMVHID